MAAVDWSDAEAALVSWVSGSISSPVVIWAHQKNPFVVDPPVVVLAFESIRAIDREDAVESFNEDADFDEEIETETRCFWECRLSVEIRTANSNVTGDSSPHALATGLLNSLRQESVHSALQAAGLSFIDETAIELAPELFKNTWQPRALFTARFNAMTTATEGIGYIATVRLNTTAPLPVETLPDMVVG